MVLFNKEIQIIEKLKNNKTNTIKVKSLNGYDSIREIDEHNTMSVKYPVVNEKTKPELSIGLQLN